MAEQSMGGIPLEIVAAIAAVLSTVLETSPDQLAIRSIEPLGLAPAAAAAPGPWAVASRMEQHLARRQFGLRAR